MALINDGSEKIMKSLQALYLSGQLKQLWENVTKVSDRKAWTFVAETALKQGDLRSAKRIYQQVLRDAGMVVSLKRLEKIEDKAELMGHISVIFKQFDLAQVKSTEQYIQAWLLILKYLASFSA